MIVAVDTLAEVVSTKTPSKSDLGLVVKDRDVFTAHRFIMDGDMDLSVEGFPLYPGVTRVEFSYKVPMTVDVTGKVRVLPDTNGIVDLRGGKVTVTAHRMDVAESALYDRAGALLDPNITVYQSDKVTRIPQAQGAPSLEVRKASIEYDLHD